MCAGAEEPCSLKQEAVTSTSLYQREHDVAGVACSAGEHRGEARHQSSHASKAALQQPGAPLHMGRKTLLSKLRMLPNCKRQLGRRVPSLGLLLVGFLVKCGRVAFFLLHIKGAKS